MKKRILFLGNFSLANTGFAKANKNLITRLYKTGKYEIAELAAGLSGADPSLHKLPWKSYGVMPKDNAEKARYEAADENGKRLYQYGLFRFDEAVLDFKPHIVVCHEDVWAWAAWLKSMKTYGKFIPVAWHPFDAEPLSEEFVAFLKDIKHIYTYGEWSKQIGIDAGLCHTEVATLGVDNSIFKPLSNRDALRLQYRIQPTDYVVLMVARLQVRKRFETLFESLHDMEKSYPELYKRVKIIPYCNFKDPAGFEIPKFWRSRKIPTDKILIPYICTACKQYHLADKYFDKNPMVRLAPENAKCPSCGRESCQTPSVVDGLTDNQLNEVYNVSDLFVLPTSNEGMGLPIVEAKAAGLITISTGYSTSKELTLGNNSGFAFDYSKYVEYGTFFYKANITSEEIAKKINQAFVLPPHERRAMEKRARELVLSKYNWDNLAQVWENRLDAMEVSEVDWDAKPQEKNPNPDAPVEQKENPIEWIISLYKNILDADIMAETGGKPEENQGVKYWMWELTSNNRSRQDIEACFRDVARKDVQEKHKVTLKDILDPNDTKRMLCVIPQSAGDNLLFTAVVDSLKTKYPEHSIYIATKEPFFGIWHGNPYVKKVIPFNDAMMMYGAMEGVFEKGLFDICWMPTIMTQRNPPAWHHNGNSKSFLT